VHQLRDPHPLRMRTWVFGQSPWRWPHRHRLHRKQVRFAFNVDWVTANWPNWPNIQTLVSLSLTRTTLPKLTASSHWPSSKTCSRLTLATIQSPPWTTTEKRCLKRKIFYKVDCQSFKFWTDLTDKATNRSKKTSSRTTMTTETINSWMTKMEMTMTARI
jgi:hypothetical protein